MRSDAHNHLHDPRLDPCRDEALAAMEAADIRAAVVNGTREEDWAAVADLARRSDVIIPSFGLHPWYVPQRASGWKDALLAVVTAHPRCGIGEIGLDRWIEGHDLPEQIACFAWQLTLAAERNLPATIHCLRAWGALADVLASTPLPSRGFLLHAYGGPLEMVAGFVERGAYFSFSPYFLHDRKAAQREVFRVIPSERLLVETDAPDLAPPDARNPRVLRLPDGKVVNHPLNLDVAYGALADLRGWSLAETECVVAENFARLFGAVGN